MSRGALLAALGLVLVACVACTNSLEAQRRTTGEASTTRNPTLLASSPAPQEVVGGVFLDTRMQPLLRVGVPQPMRWPITQQAASVRVAPGEVPDMTRVVVDESGVYNLQFAAHLSNTSRVIRQVEIWLRINGADVPATNSALAVPAAVDGQPGQQRAAWNFLHKLAAGDYVEIVWQSDSTDVSLVQGQGHAPAPQRFSSMLTISRTE